MDKKYTLVDLFSGAGGLSLGFLQTQRFDIKVAFENNAAMQETYRNNHLGVDVRGDVCMADYAEIQNKYGKIDVVIGGPPCQGFSNANRQKNHAISQNNMLVKQYIRAIQELKPMAFVMENVSMLRSDVHRFYLDEKDSELFNRGDYDIPMQQTKLVLLGQQFLFDGALEIVKDQAAIAVNIWPEEYYTAMNVVYKAAKNPNKVKAALKKHHKILVKFSDEYMESAQKKYIYEKTKAALVAVENFKDENISAKEMQAEIEPAIMIQRMLSKAQEIFDNYLVVDKYSDENDLAAFIRSYAVFDYLKAILEGEPNSYKLKGDVLCAADFGAPQKRNRFVIIGIKKTLTNEVELPKGSFKPEKYRTVRDAISDLEDVETVVEVADDIGTEIVPRKADSELGESLRDAKLLRNHIITKTRDTAMQRFRALKQGENFHSLDDALKTNTYTDISRTQNTIYLRLDYNQPSGTVINVRKSMWVHPVLDRAVSVREAARLQTFPDSFVFYGTKDKQYQQVGNAVPPIMAKAIAEELANQLDKVHEEAKL